MNFTFRIIRLKSNSNAGISITQGIRSIIKILNVIQDQMF